MITDIQDKTTGDIFAGRNSKEARKIPHMLHRKAKMLLELLKRKYKQRFNYRLSLDRR